MTTPTETDPAAVGIAVPVASYDEYVDHAAVTNAAYTTSIDSLDVTNGWTAQTDGPIPQPEQMPGQLYHPSQLPDPRIAAAGGFPAVLIPEHLVSEDTNLPNGPELDNSTEERRAAIRDSRLSSAVPKPGGAATPPAGGFLSASAKTEPETPPAS